MIKRVRKRTIERESAVADANIEDGLRREAIGAAAHAWCGPTTAIPRMKRRDAAKGRSTSFRRAFIVGPGGGPFASIDVKVISTAVSSRRRC